MFLTLTTTFDPATDLGFLLHKNPGSVRSVPLWFGQAHVFFPEATQERCSAALLLEVDPVGLVRRRRRGVEAGSLEPYVNDRPYVASSFISVALAKVFGTAMRGRSDDRPELAEARIPLEIHLPVLPCRGGADLLRRLFEPLGCAVSAIEIPLDERFDAWGPSPYLDVRLETTGRLADVLNHLYVLLPVLDDQKHYWVTEDEIEKLLRRGEGWLESHPESSRQSFRRRVETPRGELDRSEGKVAAEIASLDRRVTALETERTSGRRAPSSLCRPRVKAA
jgi:3' terminal RNA ribose 2'-O-methyltransferase Hen1